ncbi:MAG: DNA polymerase [Peptococcaceae bacterium BICA1-7]|nr:MAG: DNA polymerase [Peptococcaceae bacterium BICA1-7]
MNKTKPYEISKHVVLEAFQRVKANKGAAGVDNESLKAFEENLENNLYKIWNRMSSGSYFPPPVKAIEIPKKNGGKRILGVPTVADRVAQMVVKIYFEPKVEPCFHPDSYGYRTGKSAKDALAVTRQRCWKYDWVLEFDIKGLFDNIEHEKLMKAVRKHTDSPWIILYIQRWLSAPFLMSDGTVKKRTKGTPQGGVISPVLANLFLHYAFDLWMVLKYPDKPFARYADDAVIHCSSREDAEKLWQSLGKRLLECGLELHPDKTRIVYCKDDDRQGNYPDIKFDFLGFTFRPRSVKDKKGKIFTGFTPAVSNKAKKAMRQSIRKWRMHLMPDKSITDLARKFNPVIRGWLNYYSCFYKSELTPVLRHINRALVRWVRWKYKKFARHQRRARLWLGKVARREPNLFAHWQLGIFPAAG